jgi:hypothetical protein
MEGFMGKDSMIPEASTGGHKIGVREEKRKSEKVKNVGRSPQCVDLRSALDLATANHPRV